MCVMHFDCLRLIDLLGVNAKVSVYLHFPCAESISDLSPMLCPDHPLSFIP